jgi:hypothetical protein
MLFYVVKEEFFGAMLLCYFGDVERSLLLLEKLLRKLRRKKIFLGVFLDWAFF